MEQILFNYILPICLVIITVLLAFLVALTWSFIMVLKNTNNILADMEEIQAKIFKLIRYRRSQEVLDFLNKRCEMKEKGRK